MKIDIKSNPKSAYAISQEINEKVKGNHLEVRDGVIEPYYQLTNGTYTVYWPRVGKLNITVTDDKITLETFRIVVFGPNKTITDFQTDFNEVYRRYNNTAQVLAFFNSNENKWGFPSFRRPRNFQEDRFPQHTRDLLRDIQTFIDSEADYVRDGMPYRFGCLLYGISGSGKSLSAEIIAKKYDMSIYSINLNAEGMTDNVLINLVTSVPPKSVIIFDEIEKQLQTLQANANNRVSIGGLLTAIDGPQRLSHGTIIILTSNTNNFLGPEDLAALLRVGRIDKSYRFNQTF